MEEPRYRHLAFQPRQVDADALMRARGKRKMPVGRARDIQPVGRIELLRVPVGRTDAKMQRASGRNIDATQAGVNGGSPITELIRTLESKKLLDRGPDEFRILKQCTALIRPFDQQLQPVADEV